MSHRHETRLSARRGSRTPSSSSSRTAPAENPSQDHENIPGESTPGANTPEDPGNQIPGTNANAELAEALAIIRRQQESLERQQRAMERQQQSLENLVLQVGAQPPQTQPALVTPKPKKFKMVDPERYCGGFKELDAFLQHLKQNFDTHGDLFNSDRDRVAYAINWLGSWSKHADPALRKSRTTDPVRWGQDLRTNGDPCLHDFQLFEKEIRKMFGDRERSMNAAAQAFQEISQGAVDPDETVQAYSNRVRSLWREAGWKDATAEHILYDYAWTGLRPHIKARIRPFLPVGGRFADLDELFDKATQAEIPPRQKTDKADNRANQGQNHNGKKDSSESTQESKGKKRQYRPSISTPSSSSSSTPAGKQTDASQKPPAPWVNAEEFQRRIRENKCVRCGQDHRAAECPTYSKAKPPPGENPGKKVKTSDSQQSKN
jgi:hypothetical protein